MICHSFTHCVIESFQKLSVVRVYTTMVISSYLILMSDDGKHCCVAGLECHQSTECRICTLGQRRKEPLPRRIRGNGELYQPLPDHQTSYNNNIQHLFTIIQNHHSEELGTSTEAQGLTSCIYISRVTVLLLWDSDTCEYSTPF